MTQPPSAGTVTDNANNGAHDPRTPGVNSVVDAWGQFQWFTWGWAPTVYNALQSLAINIGGVT